VTVTLTVEDDTIIIDFRDDGVGIPKHLRQDIFKPFVRADDSRNSKTGGSGLGLSIAKKIAEAHGGDLYLLDDGRKGSIFRLTLHTI
jgi:signal transduction histidine kinase